MEARNSPSGTSLPAQGQNLAGSTKTSILERTILKEASIPSPLSSELLGRSIDYDGHPKSLKKTYRQVLRQKNQLLARIRSQDYFTATAGKPECGLLCWLKFVDSQHENHPQGLRNVGKIPRLIKYAWLREFTQIALSSQSPEATSTVESASSASNVFAVIRQDSQVGGSYVIETCGQISLFINGVPVGINTRVRRLPDFAVIEADGIFFFWWRTQNALDFIPKVGQKRPFEGSQRYENLNEELPPLKRSKASTDASSTIFSQVFMNTGKPSARPTSTEIPPPARRNPNRKSTPENPPRVVSKEILMRNPRPDSISTKRSWLKKLESGLKNHRRAHGPQNEIAKESSPIGKLPPDPYDYQGLWDDQVMKSIGVVWDALRQNDILFAISPLESLQHCRKKSNTGVECKVALGPNPFIIPLTLWSEASPNIGQLGHHLLAVAQVTHSGPIRIRLMDSSPGTIPKEHIHAVIAGLIMYSGWLGKDGTRPRRVWPAIEFDECVVPEQELVNACGLNVVLNAWAEMLNISINPRRHRVKSCKDGSEEMAESADFLRQTIEIIDLAISGHMDTETILAFMIWYGYAESGIPLNPEDRDEIIYVPQLELAPLTKKIEDIIDLVNEDVTPTRFDDSYYLGVPNKDDLRFLMKNARCNVQQACKALEDANRDMRTARWFVPSHRNKVQKVETLMREMGCSAKEAQEALHEANGNSRMAHFWVQEAWRLQEEERIGKRKEAQSQIQQERRKELYRKSDRSQISTGFDSSIYESTAESGADEESEEVEDEEEEDEEEDEGDEEEDEDEDENEHDDDDNDEGSDERLRQDEEEELERAMEISLLESIRLGLQDEEPTLHEDEREQLENALLDSLHGTPGPGPGPGPYPPPRSSPPSSSPPSSPPPSPLPRLPLIESIHSTLAETSDFSGNETPTELSERSSSD